MITKLFLSLSAIRKRIERFFAYSFASNKKICPVCTRQKEEICVVCFYDFAVKKSELEKKLINEELKILITEAVISAFINFNRFLNATKPSKKNSN